MSHADDSSKKLPTSTTDRCTAWCRDWLTDHPWTAALLWLVINPLLMQLKIDLLVCNHRHTNIYSLPQIKSPVVCLIGRQLLPRIVGFLCTITGWVSMVCGRHLYTYVASLTHRTSTQQHRNTSNSNNKLSHEASLLTLRRHEEINALQHIQIELIASILDAFSPPADLSCHLWRYLARLLASLTTHQPQSLWIFNSSSIFMLCCYSRTDEHKIIRDKSTVQHLRCINLWNGK